LLGKLDFEALQAKCLAAWDASGVYSFDAKSKKPVYSIDSPPPFTSGALHMGHMLSYAYFDFAARYKRMRGFEVFYPQGWDCQGFPTEVKVRAKFPRASREEFLAHAHDFTEANIAKMKSQMRAMGFSPDWNFEYKTMSDDYHRRVQYSLLKMFNDGLVYRAKHPVLWCPKCASAIAKAETEDKERETRLNFVFFRVASPSPKSKNKFLAGEKVTIATTRPEFLHACVAVAVHPEDVRYSELVGAEIEVPLFKQKVKVIADRDVDAAFGTGIVMICTFGDRQDVVWAYRLGLRVIEALDECGRLINAGVYDGMKAKDARAKILEALRTGELFEREEALKQSVKVHDRCGSDVEFLPSFQWFIRLKGAGEDVVRAGREMKWVPAFTLQYLVDWAQGLEWDWVISRQNVFGTPLPFWYCEKCGEIHVPEEKRLPVDPTKEKHGGKCGKCGGGLVGETSVCDCWVDSSITPLVIARWPDDEAFFSKVYPATLRPQGLEIIRTWAFYTIYRCLKLTGKAPFRELLINGSVLGTDGKKMSKSAGNYEDPEALLKRYPADALRQWAALSGAFAKDRPFSYKDVDFAKSFLNKLWNAAKFVETSTQDFDKRKNPEKNGKLELVDQWLLAKCDACVAEATRAWEEYDYFAAINAVHQFFWKDFCDAYLEDVKYRIYADAGSGVSAESREAAQYALRTALEKTLLLLAPFACFTCEEIYSSLYAKNAESVHAQAWPEAERKKDERVESIVGAMHAVIGEIRKFKAGNGLALNAPLPVVTVRCSEAKARDLGDVIDEIKAVAKVGNVVVEKMKAKEKVGEGVSEGLIVECSK